MKGAADHGANNDDPDTLPPWNLDKTLILRPWGYEVNNPGLVAPGDHSILLWTWEKMRT